MSEDLGKIKEWAPLIATGQKPAGSTKGTFRQIFENSDGEERVSQFDIGPEEYHQRVFIEYERTFGRGKAFRWTHGDAPAPLQHEVGKILSEYRHFAKRIRNLAMHCDESEANEFIAELRSFRREHQGLYEDVPEFRAKRKFAIREVKENPALQR